MKPSDDDEQWMRRAISLARRGRTSPNPKVGAVLVREGRLLSEGFHRAAGLPHAEVEALSRIDHRAEGATLYVTLEPCAHVGRTPPCVDAVLAAGVGEVVAGMVDPDPRVQGKGLAKLREAGVRVRVGLLEEACQALNPGFLKAKRVGLPFLTLKLAATADGRTATRAGASQWITSCRAREAVHRLRALVDVVLVGAGTVAADNPRLSVRLKGRHVQPARAIMDSTLRSPLDAHVFSDGNARTLVLTTERAEQARVHALLQKGIAVIRCAMDSRGHVDPRSALEALVDQGYHTVLAEPGAKLAWSLCRAGVVDRYWFFYAPKLFSGPPAYPMLEGEGVEAVADALPLQWSRPRRLGDDWLLEAFPIATPSEKDASCSPA